MVRVGHSDEDCALPFQESAEMLDEKGEPVHGFEKVQCDSGFTSKTRDSIPSASFQEM